MRSPCLIILLALALPLRSQADEHDQILAGAMSYLDANDPDSGLYVVERALRLVGPDADPEVLYYLRSFRAEQLYYHGFYDEAITDAVRSRRLAQAMGDSLLVASALNLIGLLHENIGDPKAAVPFFHEALAMYPHEGRSRYSVSLPHHIHGNLGQSLTDMGQLDSALLHLERSRLLARTAGVPRGVAIADWAIGKVLLLQDMPDSAIVRFDRSIGMAMADAQYDVALENYADKAQALIDLGDGKGAAAQLHAGRAFEQKHPITPVTRRTFHRRAALLFAELGRHEEAFLSGRAWFHIDSIIHRRNERAILETARQLFDTNTELEVQRLESQLYAEALERVRFSRLALAVGGAVALLVLLAFYLAVRSRQRGRQRLAELEMLRLQQERTIAELRIREQVGRDMHDDLGAGLGALKLRCEMALRTEGDAERRAQLGDMAQRAGDLITSMRQIIWAMNNDQGSLEDLVAYSTSYARNYLEEHGLHATIHATGPWPAIQLTSHQRRNFFLVVKETLHNVVKHANAHGVGMTMTWEEGLLLTVADDGQGMDPGTMGGEGHGLRNIRRRIADLGGQVTIDGSKGTRIICQVPLSGPNKSSIAVTGITSNLRPHEP